MTSGFDPMGHETPAEDLTALHELSSRCCGRVNWPLEPVEGEAIEIGTWAGSTAQVLSQHFRTLHCIDTWEGNPCDRLGDLAARYGPKAAFQTFCRNVGHDLLFKRVWPHAGRSLTYAAIWPRQADLIFIDADHRYEAVKADILAWRPHVRSGGILCGHDFGVPGLPGVQHAVEEIFGREGFKVIGRTVWYVEIK